MRGVSGRKESTRLAASVGAALMLAAAPARLHAQTDAPVTAASGVVAYPSSFFDPFRPSNAKDMVERTPGFTFQAGEEVRGFGGASGNVLIDGARPASKSVPLDQVLQRIPTAAIERIEVIRGGAPGIDMQGQSVVANIVRKKGAASTKALQLMGKFYENGFVGRVLRGEATWRAGDLSVEGQTVWRHDLATDSGDGSLVRSRANGVDRGPASSDVAFDLYQANGAAEHRGGYGTLRLNAAAEIEDTSRLDLATLQLSNGASQSEQTEIDRFETSAEFGAELERTLRPGLNLQLLALQRLEGEKLDARSLGRSGEQVSDEKATAGESIGRGVLRWTSDSDLKVEAGAEAAFNFLDANSALVVNGTPVQLPSANVRIEERRGEVFTTFTAQPFDRATVEAGLRVEGSSIRQTGGAEQEKTFVFPKPRLVVSWDAGPVQVGLRVERVLGQLDFEDFAASSELDVGTVNAGNADLEPERAWLTELTLERRFWGGGAIIARLSHSEVDKVVDLIPVAGAFDAPGNIGSGTRDEASLSLALPLDRLGVAGGQLRLNGTWRESKVTDPVTGESRRISAQRPFEGDVFLSKSFPAWRSTAGLEGTFGFRETSYRINEIRTIDEAGLWKAIWDWTPRKDLLFRFQYENFTGRARVRERTTFVGSRAAGVVNQRERRSANYPPLWTARVRKLF